MFEYSPYWPDGRNPIDPLLQDNVLFRTISSSTFYHIGCAVNLHSITNSGLIPGGQTFKQGKTDGTLYSRESHA